MNTIIEEIKALTHVEHRVFNQGLYANDNQTDNQANSTSSSPQADCHSSSDTRADLVYGVELFQPSAKSTAKATLNAKTDALFDEWLGLHIDWADVVKIQYTVVGAEVTWLRSNRCFGVLHVKESGVHPAYNTGPFAVSSRKDHIHGVAGAENAHSPSSLSWLWEQAGIVLVDGGSASYDLLVITAS
ncbi:unnamed protein product [Phytophthora fragariaefolia]|uniref:Unnamed protein product n=1 Tax=Phytophthora fragariaefolia TaxID=1490495 RepID=A0A9W6YET7_9STRA|nr:unnamed protein product [Phytophthora fragariaefolia]